ncbi:MAG: hypothetical protein R3C56_33380 [Pirellulaceae bacterium]
MVAGGSAGEEAKTGLPDRFGNAVVLGDSDLLWAGVAIFDDPAALTLRGKPKFLIKSASDLRPIRFLLEEMEVLTHPKP